MRTELICVVAAAIGWLSGALGPAAAADSAVTTAPDSARAATADTTAPVLLPDRVAAYYFHPTIRCHSCRWIEASADSTIHAAFPAAIQEGRLEWRAFNFEEEPEGRMLAEQLGLEGSTLVIAQLVDSEIVRSLHVDQAWYMVGKPKELYDHVCGRVTEYLGEKPQQPEAR